MKFFKIALHGVIFTCLVYALSVESAQIKDIESGRVPFWRGKTKVFNKIHEERDIVVYVKSEPLNDKSNLKRLTMQGIGIVNINAKRAFAITKQFEDLSTMSEHIREVKFDEKKKKLFMHSAAFKYEARMWMDVELDTATQARRIRFKIVDGVFTGLVGVVSFRDLPNYKSQITLQAEYDYKKLAIPQFFVEFGLEVILQKIAAKVRKHIERKKQRSSI